MSNSKKIALLCQHFYPEMVSTGLLMTELCSRLSELGWDTTVYCARPSWDINAETSRIAAAKESNYQGIHIIRVPTLGEQQSSLFSRLIFACTFLISTMIKLWQERKRYDGLVLTTNPPFLGLAGWLFSRLYRKPYLLIVHDVYPDIAINLGLLSSRSLLARLWEQVTRLILKGAGVVVVIGRDMDTVIRTKLPANQHERLVMIPNWSDERAIQMIAEEENEFVREYNPEGAFLIQYAGRMGRTHNLEPFIEAARLLRDEKVLFQFIGEGAKRDKLQALAKAEGLSNLQFLPYQPVQHLAQMLSAADLAIVCLEQGFAGLSVPSKSYGIIASGTPLLAMLKPESEIGQMIKETGCGVVLAEPNAEQIVKVVRKLMADQVQLQALGRAGRDAFLKNYTLSHAAYRYNLALTAMLDQKLPVSLD